MKMGKAEMWTVLTRLKQTSSLSKIVVVICVRVAPKAQQNPGDNAARTNRKGLQGVRGPKPKSHRGGWVR